MSGDPQIFRAPVEAPTPPLDCGSPPPRVAGGVGPDARVVEVAALDDGLDEVGVVGVVEGAGGVGGLGLLLVLDEGEAVLALVVPDLLDLEKAGV